MQNAFARFSDHKVHQGRAHSARSVPGRGGARAAQAAGSVLPERDHLSRCRAHSPLPDAPKRQSGTVQWVSSASPRSGGPGSARNTAICGRPIRRHRWA
ncbi:hypothetical protein VM95_09055 [Streptomyces rubellomurinus]|uniref:Uncharacterized protein n=1 Tax=Streptomyces rubellomurinus (strain ATCC 31215) TaxID=359131 RepID=A0A0F2TGI1_STRR3|nr:hypothetical protein VM95_09055 [Streptomyces rubellomurinus]